MTYEDIWQKIKAMSQRNRKMLAYETSLSISKHHDGKELVGYIHPHYYFDAKAVHDILFYPVNSQKEIDDDDGSYFKILKSIIEDDRKVHLRIKRHSWLPRFVNDRCRRLLQDHTFALVSKVKV